MSLIYYHYDKTDNYMSQIIKFKKCVSFEHTHTHTHTHTFLVNLFLTTNELHKENDTKENNTKENNK